MEALEKICSKCSKNPPSNGNAWCQECRSDHARKARETEAFRIAAKNWERGALAIRFMLAQQMAKCPGSTFEGHEMAKWIMEFPLPPYAVNR